MAGLGVLIWLILILVERRSRVPRPRGPALSRVRIGWTGWIGRLTWIVDFRYFPSIDARRTPANCWCLSFGPFRLAKRRKAKLALHRMKFGADET